MPPPVPSNGGGLMDLMGWTRSVTTGQPYQPTPQPPQADQAPRRQVKIEYEPEMVVDIMGNLSLGLRATSGQFDFTPATRCITKTDPLLPAREVADAAECEAWCMATQGCNAAQFNHPWRVGLPCSRNDPDTELVVKDTKAPNFQRQQPCIEKPTCDLYAHCLERARAAQPMRSDVFHRWGPTWPPNRTPNDVRWRTNATIVMVSYHASLSYLRSLPGGLADLVVYHKADIGKPNVTHPPMTASYVLSHLKEQELCSPTASPVTLRRLHHPSRSATCPNGCVCGRRPRQSRPWLQYFALLPNYGLQYKEPYGGSREPYGYLQFIIDFWDNLPPVVIFSQDDCLARGCAWGNQVPNLPLRLARWEREWGEAATPSSRNCLCKFIREDKYRNRGYFWYRWMSFAQERIFNVTLEARDSIVTWPQDATFAVGAAWIRAQPRWLFESLTRLSTVELSCMGAGTIMWAHSFERLWFELFDTRVTKTIRPAIETPGKRGGPDKRGACFLGARRRR